jgi:hypothetical protein
MNLRSAGNPTIGTKDIRRVYNSLNWLGTLSLVSIFFNDLARNATYICPSFSAVALLFTNFYPDNYVLRFHYGDRSEPPARAGDVLKIFNDLSFILLP